MQTDSQMLATVVEQGRNMEKNLDAHTREDHERFDKIFSYIKEEFGVMEARLIALDGTIANRLRPIENKVETLWDDKNTQNGALKVGKYVAGVFGGIIGAIGTMIINQHGGSQ